MNRALFGKTAKQLCEERKCNRDDLRNTHEELDLKKIEHIEENAMKLIDKRDTEPLLAIQQALDLYL